jgi:LmbE family N-acetylglucosaminyl deacetylase
MRVVAALNNNGKHSVLAIGAHPDDIEFGCAGTLYRFIQEGHSVFFLIMTNGRAGGNPEERRDEQLNSAKFLGVKEVFWGDFEDARLDSFSMVIQKIEAIVKQTSPTLIFVHYGNDSHQDHRQINECTISATRNIPNVLFYEGPTTFGFKPNVYTDIRPYIKQKFTCLSCHNSQVNRTNIESQSILEIARANAIFRGAQCRIPYAEAFCSLRLFL